jgi:glycosyltransferase involved in cell wall biosynthesis
MIQIGIGASNIRSGGAVTHLCEILKALDLKKTGIESIEVWSNKVTLAKMEPKEGIALNTHPALEKGLLNRFYWQQMTLTSIARERYDILYIPGGSYLGSFSPFVTMNRNLQPFDDETRSRYQPSFQKYRLALLEKIQAQTYKKAEGVIFLSDEAKRVTLKKLGRRCSNTVTVPHGIAPKFFNAPKQQQPLNNYTAVKPFHFLYVSRINVYKHQEKVIEAVHLLRDEGYPVVLDLVGNIENRQSERVFKKALRRFDPQNEFVRYYGRVTQDELLEFYHSADAFVFASSCETFGQTLLEAMASALPIACAGQSAMPEILKDNGLYFDPEQPLSIRNTLQRLLDSSELRQRLSHAARDEAKTYSWKKCAASTFNFIKHVYERAN